jgi:uncharacterized membrane protein
MLSIRVNLLLVIVLAGLALCNVSSAKNLSRTGVARVLYIGEPYYSATPVPYMVSDPLIDVHKVEASIWLGSTTKIMKSMRMYMPRSYSDLLEKYDVVVLSDANLQTLRHSHVQWIGDSVEAGMGLFMAGGYETLGAYRDGVDWGPSRVGEVLPVHTHDHGFDLEMPAVVEIEDWDNPFIGSIPWERLVHPYNIFGAGGGVNHVTPKPGSDLLAWLRRLKDGHRHPFLVDWDLEDGRSMIMSADWTPAAAGYFIQWDYYRDYVLGLMLYVAQKDLPSDYDFLHLIRGKFFEYRVRVDIVYSLIEFIDKFGANARPVEEMLSEADAIREEAGTRYLHYDFNEANEEIDSALDVLHRCSQVATELKNSALIWIYLTEWSVVSATGLIGGVVLYSLMVKRRSFREVETTRGVG